MLDPVIVIKLSMPYVESVLVDEDANPHAIDSSAPLLGPAITWLIGSGGGEFVLTNFETDDVQLVEETST